MSIERGSINQRKSPGEIINQAVGNSRYVEGVTGQPLIPPSFRDIQSLGSMTPSEVINQFGTKRYDIFAEVMRAELAGRELDEERQWEIGRSLKVLNGVDQYISGYHTAPAENRVLYPKQMEVFEALGRFLANGGTEGYFKLPTAFGKTVVFTEFAKAANLKTLIVVPTLELLDQTEDTFAKLAPDLGLGKVYAYAKDFFGQITVTTYESLNRLVDPKEEDPDALDFLPEDYDLLILDEAHHALGPKAEVAVDQFSNAIKLGFTATPYYSESRHVGKLLDTLIYGMSIKEAVEEDLLSPFKVWLAMTDTDVSGVEIDSSTGDYNQSQLARIVNTTSRNQGAVDLYSQYFSGESAIVNCVSVRHAQEVARVFRERGIKAEAIWGAMGRTKRKQLVDAYKKGEVSVLCNMQLLTEGFDAPNASVCINLRPTLSGVVAEQRGGRVLRLDPNNPNKEATIIDFIDRERSGRQQLSFAEVAETSSMAKKMEGQVGTVSSFPEGWISSGTTSQSPTVQGLRVVTEITEIMRVVSEARASRVEIIAQPTGFVEIENDQFMREYGVTHATLYRYTHTLMQEYPQCFIQVGRNNRMYVSEEGLTLLKECMRNLKLPEGFSQQNITVLIGEYDISKSFATKIIRDLKLRNATDIRLRGSRVFATEKGAALIRGAFEIRREEKITFSPINTADVARTIGGDVTARMVTRALYRMVQQYPSEFRREGFGGRFITSPEGMKVLLEQLQALTIPSGFMRLNLKDLEKEYGIDASLIYVQAVALPPDQLIRRGQGRNPIDISEEGMAILKERLARRMGTSRVNMEQLGLGIGLNPEYVARLLREFMEAHPEQFLKPASGKAFFATEEGSILLQQEVERIKLEGYESFNIEKIMSEYGVSRRQVRVHLNDLMKEFPEEFTRRGRRSMFFATPAGLTRLYASLEQYRKPSGA